MKVLGLVASPRKLGNSEIIVREMMKVLPADWQKDLLRLNDLRIDRCKACYACLAAGRRCIIKDDLNFFLDQILAADKVILAAPVYFLGPQTTLKLINDRMISIQNDTAAYATGKQCVIVIPHTVNGWEGYARESSMHFARFLNLNVTGVLTVRATLPGDVTKCEKFADIRRLAASLIDGSTLDFTPADQICCPDCGSSLLQIFRRNAWRCAICDCTGSWKAGDNEFKLRRSDDAHRRFTPEGMAEHGRTLTQIKDEYIARREEVKTMQLPYQKAAAVWLEPAGD
ncbi:MAG: flavodoxin family protein [Gracilibacteraceae bacterium]|nr:flavodoxin family protein [Gracilibacteraceae bacterium]